jgi:ABC-type polysaccharide/polyol phosphate export permease
VFSLAAASAAAVNFGLSLVPLLAIQLATGWGIPWTVVLVPIPALALLGLAAGVGLIVASAAVHFYDVIDLTGVVVQLIAYLTPGFYPISIVPEAYRPFMQLNPLYHYLLVFRGFVYGGEFAPALSFAVMAVTSLGALALGVWVFSRSWRNAAALL